MELSEFLEKLAQTPRDWFIGADGELKRPNTMECPITAVDGRGLSASMFPTSAARLCIDAPLRFQIVDAADNGGKLFDRSIRNQLLKACGLEENQ
jgi:hypothetical protein